MHELTLAKKKNQEERMHFVNYWAAYVKTHPDKDWSSQQKVLIDSQLSNNIKLTREEYLKIKGEQGED